MVNCSALLALVAASIMSAAHVAIATPPSLLDGPAAQQPGDLLQNDFNNNPTGIVQPGLVPALATATTMPPAGAQQPLATGVDVAAAPRPTETDTDNEPPTCRQISCQEKYQRCMSRTGGLIIPVSAPDACHPPPPPPQVGDLRFAQLECWKEMNDCVYDSFYKFPNTKEDNYTNMCTDGTQSHNLPLCPCQKQLCYLTNSGARRSPSARENPICNQNIRNNNKA